MRAGHLVVGGLALFLGACWGCGGAGQGGHAPPPPNKQLLTGKWKNASDAQFLVGYDFADDGTVKVAVRGMGQPVRGRYTWSGERTLDLEFPAEAEVQQAYRAAAKAYRDNLEERVKAGTLLDRALPGMLAEAPTELPAKETFRVSLTDQPRLLLLIDDRGTSHTFEPAE
jgi:hypothetical protein